jgi:hypothetical protein
VNRRFLQTNIWTLSLILIGKVSGYYSYDKDRHYITYGNVRWSDGYVLMRWEGVMDKRTEPPSKIRKDKWLWMWFCNKFCTSNEISHVNIMTMTPSSSISFFTFFCQACQQFIRFTTHIALFFLSFIYWSISNTKLEEIYFYTPYISSFTPWNDYSIPLVI